MAQPGGWRATCWRPTVAVVSAFFSLILRQVGSLVRAVLGWSVTDPPRSCRLVRSTRARAIGTLLVVGVHRQVAGHLGTGA
jgi:hypothetical protein